MRPLLLSLWLCIIFLVCINAEAGTSEVLVPNVLFALDDLNNCVDALNEAEQISRTVPEKLGQSTQV